MKYAQLILKLGNLSLGDVVAVPLANSQFAHGRVYRGTLGIYEGMSDDLKTAEDFRNAKPKRFFYYISMPGSGRYQKNWRFIGHIPFAPEDDTYPPPMHARDDFGLSGTRIYHRGGFRKATRDEVRGLQIFTIYSPPALERYLAGERHDPYRKLRKRLEAARKKAGGRLPYDGALASLSTRGSTGTLRKENSAG
jgi:hypothetical protein